MGDYQTLAPFPVDLGALPKWMLSTQPPLDLQAALDNAAKLRSADIADALAELKLRSAERGENAQAIIAQQLQGMSPDASLGDQYKAAQSGFLQAGMPLEALSAAESYLQNRRSQQSTTTSAVAAAKSLASMRALEAAQQLLAEAGIEGADLSEAGKERISLGRGGVGVYDPNATDPAQRLEVLKEPMPYSGRSQTMDVWENPKTGEIHYAPKTNEAAAQEIAQGFRLRSGQSALDDLIRQRLARPSPTSTPAPLPTPTDPPAPGKGSKTPPPFDPRTERLLQNKTTGEYKVVPK